MNERQVLIIEDSPTMRQLIQFALRRIPDLSLIEANHGAEALDILASKKVDLILLDLRMPVMSGFSFLEKFADLPDGKETPVIVITTEGDQESIDRAISLGAAAYITKPVNSTDIAEVIGETLNRKKAANS